MSRDAAMALATGSPVTEAPPPLEAVTEAAPPVDDLVSSRIAQIAKKEAKYQQEMTEYKKQIAEFQDKKSKFDPFYERYKQFEEMKTKDPVAAIKLLGFSDTDYVNFVAAQEDKSTPEERAAKIAEAKINEFRQEQAQKETEATTKQHADTIAQFQKNIGITVKTNPEKLELCNFYGEAAEKLIYETVNQAFKEDLELDPNAVPMTAAEAADLVEGYYEEKLAEMRKLRKFGPVTPEPIKAETLTSMPSKIKDEPLKAEVKPGMPARTLTNRTAPTIAATVKKVETRSEKRERLMAALRAGVKP